MKVIGYSRELSVFPGDQVNFLVSCDTERYHADIVKLIHGDTNPDGPGFKIAPVSTNIDTDVGGRVQRVYSGSHVLVDDHPRLRLSRGFTLQVLIWPTTPLKGVQGLLTKWDGSREAGYGLFIGGDGCVEAWVGDGGNVERISSGKPLLAGCWYLAAMSVDDGKVTVHQEPLVTPANGRFAFATSLESTTAVVTADAAVVVPADNGVPLVMAGFVERLTDEPTGVVVGGHYNGKLDRPRVHSAVLGRDRMDMQIERPHGPSLRGAWNFQEEITGRGIRAPRRITDVSANRLHGRAVNVPTRAVTGHNWEAKEQNFIHAPEQYGAIHFHDDDLGDAVGRSTSRSPSRRAAVGALRRAAAGRRRHGLCPVLRACATRRGEAHLLSRSDQPAIWPTPTTTSAEWAPLAQLFVARAHRDVGGQPRADRAPRASAFHLRRAQPTARGLLLVAAQAHTEHAAGVPALAVAVAVAVQRRLHLLDWLIRRAYEFDVVADQDLHHEGADVLRPYGSSSPGRTPSTTPSRCSTRCSLRRGRRAAHVHGRPTASTG